MKRIDSSNKVVNLFRLDKHGFDAGLPESGIRATYFTPEWCNNVQEELCTVIDKAGLLPDGSARNQLWLAIQNMLTRRATATRWRILTG